MPLIKQVPVKDSQGRDTGNFAGFWVITQYTHYPTQDRCIAYLDGYKDQSYFTGNLGIAATRTEAFIEVPAVDLPLSTAQAELVIKQLVPEFEDAEIID